MRLILAIISLVVAALMLGLGIAQRTFLAGPNVVTAATTEETTTPVTIVDGAALNAYEQGQTVEFSGAANIFAAYGRTDDVLAWVGESTYTYVSFDPVTSQLVSEVRSGTETEVPHPAGSDLWLREYEDTGTLRFRTNLPADVSVLAVSDGVAPAPSAVSVSWPVDNSTPWSGPLIVGGAVLLLAGLALLFWALNRVRKSRGPRRTQPKQRRLPKLPKQPRYKPSKPKAIAAQKGRRARSFVAVIPTLVVGTLILAGCSAQPPVNEALLSTETPAADVVVTELQAPAVTEAQMNRILQKVSSVATEADEALDEELIATRLAGPALELRLAGYKIRDKDADLGGLTPIPSGPSKYTLPQQSDTWPRVVMAVVQNSTDLTVPPVALILKQDDPRANYKVHYAVDLEPTTVLPKVAPISVGAPRQLPNVKFLQITPDELAAAYGDILMQGEKSASFAMFEEEGDTLRTRVGVAAKTEAKKNLPSTAKLTFANAPGPGEIVVLSTNDTGAIVAVQLLETETVKPVQSGAEVTAKGAVKALSAKDSSTKGLVATYGDQLLFFVPPADDSSKVVLLGFSQGLIDAKVIK